MESVNENSETENKELEEEATTSLAPLIVRTAISTLLIAVALVFSVLSILVVVNPYGAINFYYKSGAYSSAVNAAAEYINREEKSRGVDASYKIALHEDLNNEKFIYALNRAITLSSKLMREEYEAHGVTKKAKKYAEKVERFTREYMSIFGIQAVNAQRSQDEMSKVSFIYKPYVCDYARTIQTLNYTARIILGKEDKLLYNNTISVSGENVTDIVTETVFMATTYGALTPESVNSANTDGYLLYLAQMTEYLDFEMRRLFGVIPDTENEIVERLDEIHENNAFDTNGYFNLLIKKDSTNTFTPVYTGFYSFPNYRDFVRDGFDDTTVTEAAEKLAALRILKDFAAQMDKFITIVYVMSQPAFADVNLFTYRDRERIAEERRYRAPGDTGTAVDSRWEAYRVFDYKGDKPLHIGDYYNTLYREYLRKFDV